MMSIYTGVLAVLGLAIIVTSAGPVGPESDAGLALFVAFLLRVIASSWVANVLITRGPGR